MFSILLARKMIRRTMSFENLTQQHSVKVEARVSVEECSLAVGNMGGMKTFGWLLG